MRFDDICTKKTYTSQGVEKNVWLKCGTLKTTDDGKRFIEFNHLPGITYFVFEQRKKEPTVDKTTGEAWLDDGQA